MEQLTFPGRPLALEQHPINEVLPAMTAVEFEGLASDISRHGLRFPIVLFEGKILDGWHRYRACCEVDIDPRYQEFDGSTGDAIHFVISLNLIRGTYTAGQRAVIALEIERRLSEVTDY